MLLTITTTHKPATDLGFLLHKNPERLRSYEMSFGQAHVFYPQVSDDQCTAALLLEVDPIGLVRRSGRNESGIEHYVNDRPYAASSFLSVAISKAFRTAMTGRSKERPDLAEQPIPLEVRIPALPCRGGEVFLRSLFEPLGYEVEAIGHALDEEFSDWGPSRYLSVTLKCNLRLRDVLSHLYVLIPVLDDDKHYWVGDDEVEKLLRNARSWLPSHPARERIVERYLKHRRNLARQALARLLEEDQTDPDAEEEEHLKQEEELEERIGLGEQRMGAVLAALRSSGATTVADLGCGSGRFLHRLLDDSAFTRILGMDVSYRTLEAARSRLRWERMPPRKKARISLIQGSLTYRDERLSGFDAAVLIEVIEHLDESRLRSFERVVFEFARPQAVVVTTPNVEYNARFEALPSGQLRHKDHRFEWTRQQFSNWGSGVGERFGYSLRILPVGTEDPEVGAPTQMAVFCRAIEA
jgi:3' terminal RNA ribose 2'-O-methyltransferase Hen1